MRSFNLIAILLFFNCSYFLKEPGRPPKYKDQLIDNTLRKIYIQNIQNDSYGEAVHITLTQLLKAEIDRRGRFIQTRKKEEAAYRLYGSVTHYQKIGNLLDAYGQQISSEISIIVKFQIQEAGTGERIQLEREEILSRAYFSDQIGYRESEEQAQSRLLRNLSYRISEESENAWYFHVVNKYYKKDIKENQNEKN